MKTYKVNPNKLVPTKSMQAFSTEPILRKNTRKALVTPKQLERLLDTLIQATEQLPDEYKVLMQSEIAHRYNVWLEKHLASHKAQDFLIDENAKVTPSEAVDSN